MNEIRRILDDWWSNPSAVLGTLGRGSPAITYSISGTVYDADGSTAVSDATIALGALSTTSAANGTFTISSVPAGTSGSLTATKTGYSWAAISIAAMSGNLTGQNFINAFWAAGGSAASIVAAYRFIGAASFSASKVNIVSPGTHDLVNAASFPTWDATNGLKHAASQYLISDILLNGDYTAIIRFSNAVQSGEPYIFGAYGGTGQFAICPFSSNNFRWLNLNNRTSSPPLAQGVVAIAGTKSFRNGVQDLTNLGVGGAGVVPAFVGGVNANGSYYGSGAKYIQSLTIHSVTLTDAQVTAISTAQAALTP